MRIPFTTWVLQELKNGPMSDEELCGKYIELKYTSRFGFETISPTKLAVWGKKYSTCERILRRMRLKGKIQEVSRKHRKNNSDEILFTIA